MEKSLKNEVIPIWQPQGYSTYQITKDVAAKLGVKATHTGVLDPMAEGVIIVLVGDTRFEKNKYSNGHKVYEFSITFGISTDSYDGMGLITSVTNALNADLLQVPDEKAVSKILPPFIGKYIQTVPLYSAQKVNGKKLFMYPRLGEPSPALPTKQGEIFDLQLVAYKSVQMLPLVAEILEKIKNIRLGEFRQEEIISNWQKFQKELLLKTTAITATFCVTMSRGMYVRSLSQDICAKLGTLGFVSSLIRLQNGIYTKSECCTLEEVC